MSNFLVVVDNLDRELGDYFFDSYFNLSECIDSIDNANIITLSDDNCDNVNINKTIKDFNSKPFLFIGISHGNESELLTSSSILVDSNNSMNFTNSFFYTAACLCGIELGPRLILEKCKCFIGYIKKVQIVSGHEASFIECENQGIEAFCKHSKTTKESFDSIVEKYNSAIDKYLTSSDINDVIIASTLVSNKDSLIILGDYDLTFDYFTN
jgi:hypothetical protein